MKWFKHSVDSHDDPDISDAEDLFGDAGYVIFFKILELYAREFNHTSTDGNIKFSFGFLKRKLRKSSAKVEQTLNFYQKKQRIFFQKCDDGFIINVPKFIEIADNWAKRKVSKTTELLQSSDVETTQSYKNKEVRSKNIEKELKEKLKKESEKIIEFFENFFWKNYPKRNGSLAGKKECLEFIKKSKLTDQDLLDLKKAVLNYRDSKQAIDGYAKDPIRFLKKDYWRDWINISPVKSKLDRWIDGELEENNDSTAI